MGYPYGLSFQAQAFESRNSLAKALQAALSAEYPVCPIAEMEMFAYDKDVSPCPLLLICVYVAAANGEILFLRTATASVASYWYGWSDKSPLKASYVLH